MNNNPHIGSSLDDLLEEEGTLAEINSIALKRVIAWQAGDKDGETPFSREETRGRGDTGTRGFKTVR